MTEPIKLPTGVARDMYQHARKRGKGVRYALQKAAEVDACPDEMACCQCGVSLHVSDPASVRGRELWCHVCIAKRPKTLAAPADPPSRAPSH
jgi:hypothetical protein